MSKVNIAKYAQILNNLSQDPFDIAVDTEFEGKNTLTIQAACRLDPNAVAVHVFRSLDIPPLPREYRIAEYVSSERIRLSTSTMTATLSPADFLAGLFGRGIFRDVFGLTTPFQEMGFDEETEPNVINVTFIGHFLTADLARIFGHQFFAEVLTAQALQRPLLKLRDQKLLGFEGVGQFAGRNPAVQYAVGADGKLYQIELGFRDTNLLFGSGSLDKLGQTFTGIAKCSALSSEEKSHMRRTFQARTADAYGYAISDAILTLKCYEAMQEKHAAIYRQFGFHECEIPPIKPTVGGWLKEFLIRSTFRSVSSQSRHLSSLTAMKRRMELGGSESVITGHAASRFGEQTGQVHGGLLFSRSPNRFWHECPRQLRDVDLAGCYSTITSQGSVYWGRPVVFEPGSNVLSLREAVSLVQCLAENDGWILRVTGDITAIPNVLIPSTQGAITSENYRSRNRRKSSAEVNWSNSTESEDRSGTRIFSQRIEAGVIAYSTWLMIQALPEAARIEYENLRVESMLLYPRSLIAETGQDFDRLMDQHHKGDVPWTAQLDLTEGVIHSKEEITNEHVSLRFDLGQIAEQIRGFRQNAQKEAGKGSGMDMTWKLVANSLFGVLCCQHFPVNNVVAANRITATARAIAFAMQMSLNGIQVITDGCTYRRDQIPACTFAECLERQPDYPLRRADEGSDIPFHNPKSIPQDDGLFTEWYRRHLVRFFQISDAALIDLLSMHQLSHKKPRGCDHPAFDALATDGSGNSIKCLRNRSTGKIEVLESAIRGYGRESKALLEPWMVETYAADQLKEAPPLTSDESLLKLKPALQRIRKAAKAGLLPAMLPLGFSARKILNYAIIKPSAYIFQNPQQESRFKRLIEKFREQTGCGLELIALRRGYGDRQQGSLADLAATIYEFIQNGGSDLSRTLHLSRLGTSLEEMARDRRDTLREQKHDAEIDLFDSMRLDDQDLAEFTCGLLVDFDMLRGLGLT